MKTVFKDIFMLVFAFFLLGGLTAQNAEQPAPKPINKGWVTLGYNYGNTSMFGDIGRGTDVKFSNRFKFAHQLALEKRFNKYVGAGLYGRFGKMAENENTLTSRLNFENTFNQFGVYAKGYTDWDGSHIIAPFLAVGISYMTFDVASDLKDAQGNEYYYWSDGVIRDLPEVDRVADPTQWYTNLTFSQILDRDYVYETPLANSFDASNTTYKRSTLVFPITFGFRLKFYEFLEMRLSGTYNITQTDFLDNFSQGKNDHYLYTAAGMYFTFGKKYIDPKERRYQGVDFDQIASSDADGDGVEDISDKCPNTKKGEPVTADGCPLDDDNDGVPNYLDKEPNSKPNASGQFIVDRYGRALTDEQIAKMEETRKGLYMERSEKFYEAPSLDKLKEFDVAKSSGSGLPSNGSGTGSVSRALPNQYHYADFNSNGIIEADEISRVIDEFFSGENDVSVSDIMDLIDFFFEQY